MAEKYDLSEYSYLLNENKEDFLCWRCIHLPVCSWRMGGEDLAFASASECETFDDASQYAKKPCKVGDTIYLLVVDKNKPIDSNVVIKEDGVHHFIVGNNFIQIVTDSREIFDANKFGVTAFYNRKDAEDAQKKMNRKVEHI